MVDIDSSDFSRLSADLGKVPPASGRNLRQAIEVTARHVRDEWRDQARGMAHAPAFPHSITYDIGSSASQSLAQAAGSIIGGSITAAHASVLSAEIGPDKSRAQGSLGNLIEYGSVNNAPQGLGHRALQVNEEDFERGVDRAIDDALKAAGL